GHGEDIWADAKCCRFAVAGPEARCGAQVLVVPKNAKGPDKSGPFQNFSICRYYTILRASFLVNTFLGARAAAVTFGARAAAGSFAARSAGLAIAPATRSAA